MSKSKKNKTVTANTAALLKEGEGQHADFKRTPDGISQDDLVAFANSGGGAILAGVAEEAAEDGSQIGIAIGCDVSDGMILQIANKALSCLPPVAIDVSIENVAKKPFLRIDIPSSPTKPHCTAKGVYCTRAGRRNRALQPSELLQIFLENESRAFTERFEAAAGRISEDLGKLESSLDDSIRSMSDQLGWADYQLGDTESTLGTIQAMVGRLTKESGDVSTRLRTLFKQDKRDDPVRERERLKYLTRLVEGIRDDPERLKHVAAGGELSLKDAKTGIADISEEDAKELLKLAVKHVREQEDMKRYAVAVKAPSKCTEKDFDEFAALITAGGEVADGVRDRIKRAFRLGCITYDGKVVGTAALKRPAVEYRAKVFDKAKSTHAPADYPYDLGWIFLEIAHRKKGQMTRLLKELMPAAKNNALLATTRSSNEIMLEMLPQLGFEKSGDAYPSEHQPGEMIELYLRAAPESKPKSK